MIMYQGTMNRMKQEINNTKFVDTSAISKTIMEDLEVEDDSLEIVTINHDDQYNVLHPIKNDSGMQYVLIKT